MNKDLYEIYHANGNLEYPDDGHVYVVLNNVVLRKCPPAAYAIEQLKDGKEKTPRKYYRLEDKYGEIVVTPLILLAYNANSKNTSQVRNMKLTCDELNRRKDGHTYAVVPVYVGGAM